MKIVQTLAIAALLAGSTVAASADSFFYPTFNQGQTNTPAVNSDQLVTGRSVSTSNANSQIEEPAISPNGNPGLSDFAAHKYTGTP